MDCCVDHWAERHADHWADHQVDCGLDHCITLQITVQTAEWIAESVNERIAV